MHEGEALIKIRTWSTSEDFAKAIFDQAVRQMKYVRDVESVEVTVEPRFHKVEDE